MKQELQTIQTDVLGRISKAAQGGDLELVTQLSGYATKIKELSVAYQRLESEVEILKTKISDLAKGGSGGDAQTLASASASQQTSSSIRSRQVNGRAGPISIEIDWSKNGQPFGTEVISEPFASETLVTLFSRLHHTLGPRVLEVGSRIQINRGPFISENPNRDFANHSRGGTYSHHQIPGTRFYVLTHSQTDQKVHDIRTLLKALALTPGSYQISKHPTQQ
jgi:hypothetical protein